MSLAIPFAAFFRRRHDIFVKHLPPRLTRKRLCQYTPTMKLFIRKHAAISLALLALCAQGCSRAPEAEDTLVQLTAPTVAPIVTPVPTPVATPTPLPTPKPTPKATEKPKETDKPKETPKPTEKPKRKANTPYADSYTPVELKSYNRKVESFSSTALDGSTITESYFGGGTLTLVNVWSTT